MVLRNLDQDHRMATGIGQKQFDQPPQGLARGRRLEGNAEVSQARLLPAGSQSVENPFARAGQFEEAAAQGAGCSGCVALSQIQVNETPAGRGTRAPLRTWRSSVEPRRHNGRCAAQGVGVRRTLPPGKKHRRQYNRAAPASSE
jgi:hypothetical protein